LANHDGRQRLVPWKVHDIAIAIALVFLGFLAAILVLAATARVADVDERAVLSPWLTGILEGLMVLAVWVFGIRKYRVGWRALGFRGTQNGRSFALPWLALLGSLLFTGLYTVIVRALGLESLLPPPLPEDALGSGVTRLLNSLVIVVWGPFAEEVFFRGFLLAGLVPAFGLTWAAIISSTIFAAAHMSLGSLIPIFVTGLLLAWLYIKTRSLWPPITAHAIQNLIALSVTV
jgi:membrane protease YdiL (CAAX protease family)